MSTCEDCGKDAADCRCLHLDCARCGETCPGDESTCVGCRSKHKILDEARRELIVLELSPLDYVESFHMLTTTCDILAAANFADSTAEKRAELLQAVKRPKARFLKVRLSYEVSEL